MGPLEASINNFINLGTSLALIAVVLFYLLAGWQFMTSGGSPNGVERAKGTAFNTTLGLLIILSARTIGNLISGAIVR